MDIERIPLRTLKASGQPRPLITEAVDKLAASIREVGLIQPISVRCVPVMDGGVAVDGYQIVAGHHRVAAARALGWTEIDAIIVDAGEHLQAELIEIDENLCRAELTASQRAQAIKRRTRRHLLAAGTCIKAEGFPKLPTDCLQTTGKKKAHYSLCSALSLCVLVGPVGVEPTTNGLRVRCSTN